MDGAFILGMSMGGGGGFAAGLDLQQAIISCVTIQEVEQDAFASAYGFFPAAFVYHSGHNAEEDELFGSSGGGPHGERSDDALGLQGEVDLGMGDGSDEFLDALLELGAPGVVEATEAEAAQAGVDEGGGDEAEAALHCSFGRRLSRRGRVSFEPWRCLRRCLGEPRRGGRGSSGKRGGLGGSGGRGRL